jgi:hypothetical protein
MQHVEAMTCTAINSLRSRRSAPAKQHSTDWVGFEVLGPDGSLGVVEAVQLSGQPPLPLVLVVRSGNVMSLVSARRIRRVIRDESTVIVGPPAATSTALPASTGFDTTS